MEVYVVYCNSDKKPMKYYGGFRVFENKETAENYINISNAIQKTDLYVKKWEVK